MDTSGEASRGLGGILELRVQFPLSFASLGPKQAAAAVRGRQLGYRHSQSPSLNPGDRGLCEQDAGPRQLLGQAT